VKAESDGMVERIRASGGSVDYVVFEDEGHGLLKVDNQIRANRAIAEFLERHLR
jgi:dipeptidyl aminopeptidase/acylaminoacyl peptidase